MLVKRQALRRTLVDAWLPYPAEYSRVLLPVLGQTYTERYHCRIRRFSFHFHASCSSRTEWNILGKLRYATTSSRMKAGAQVIRPYQRACWRQPPASYMP